MVFGSDAPAPEPSNGDDGTGYTCLVQYAGSAYVRSYPCWYNWSLREWVIELLDRQVLASEFGGVARLVDKEHP